MIVTKTELNKAGCGSPGCTHDHSTLFLTAACHPAHGLEVKYVKEKEQLVVTCYVCETEVTTIQL